MISKDQSIVTQVAAKIAAELIVKDTNTMSNITEWLIAFDAVSEALNNAHGFNLTTVLKCFSKHSPTQPWKKQLKHQSQPSPRLQHHNQ